MQFKQLRRWQLLLLTGVLLTVSLATTTVAANTETMTVTANTLNVRQGPGLAYATMGQIPKGSRLTILQKKNSWYQVRLAANRVGWIASWLVNQNPATQDAAKVAKVIGDVNVRQYANANAKLLGRLKVGDPVNVLYQEKDWSQITYDNTAAWVASEYLETTGTTKKLIPATQPTVATPKDQPTVTAKTTTNANLRATAGLNSRVVAKLKANTTVTVLSQGGDWYKVQTQDKKTGYLASWVISVPSVAGGHVATKLSEATIVLDPGHGGEDVGALSTSGKYEKKYTLAIATAVGAKLQAAGAKVLYTRADDTFVDLNPRPQVANKANADAFISFHFDSSPSVNTASGFTTYYYNKTKDKPLADALNQAFAKNLPLTNRGVAFADYAVLRTNEHPSVLLELGYINTNKDFALIANDAYHQQVATDIASGLTKYFDQNAKTKD